MTEFLNFDHLQGRKIAFPEHFDSRVQQAAGILNEKFGIQAVYVSQDEADQRKDFTSETIKYILQKKNKKPQKKHLDAATDPYYLAGAMLQNQEVSAVVAGCACPTAHVLRSVLATNLLRPETEVLTSCFYMEFPDVEKNFVFADCAVIPEPSAKDLAEIAFLAQDAYTKWTGNVSRTAFLSFSTEGSALHPTTQKVKNAFDIFHMRHSDMVAYGEIQFDAAYVPTVSQRKCPSSPLYGEANVFVFPDLNSGNICYKVAQYIGNGNAYGPVLLGCEKPYSDLSRGATVDEIVSTSLLTLSLAEV